MATKNYNVEEELHLKFKIMCIEKGTDMSKEIRKFIHDFVGDYSIPKITETENTSETNNNLNF